MARARNYLMAISLSLLGLMIGVEGVLSPGGPGATVIPSARLQNVARGKPTSRRPEPLSIGTPAPAEELPNQQAASLATEPVAAIVQKSERRPSKSDDAEHSLGLPEAPPLRKRVRREAGSRRQDEIYYRSHPPTS